MLRTTDNSVSWTAPTLAALHRLNLALDEEVPLGPKAAPTRNPIVRSLNPPKAVMRPCQG